MIGELAHRARQWRGDKAWQWEGDWLTNFLLQSRHASVAVVYKRRLASIPIPTISKLLRNVKIQYFEICDLIFISFLLIYGQEQFRFDYLFWIISMYWQQQLPNWLIEWNGSWYITSMTTASLAKLISTRGSPLSMARLLRGNSNSWQRQSSSSSSSSLPSSSSPSL